MYCLRLFLSLLLLFISPSTATTKDDVILKEVHRILKKRSIFDNIALDDPKAECRNGGIFAGGICHCMNGQTGKKCEHFDCGNELGSKAQGSNQIRFPVKGFSTGSRFDPESLFLSSPCICPDGYKGELCEYQPAAKCGNKGEWKKDRCQCMGFHFGSECQYTSKCVEGFLRNGRCICYNGFEGEYCDQIVCVFGSRNYKNRTLSCHCPEKYTGRRCDQCKKTGPLLEPFPDCQLDPGKRKHIEMAAQLRHKVKSGVSFFQNLATFC